MKTLVSVFCYNEGEKIRKVLEQFPNEKSYDVVIMNDGSHDQSLEIFKEFYFTVLSHKMNLGVGASMKTVFQYAIENNYEVIVLIAGNGKMKVSEIPRLLEPIYNNGIDYVQGSRYIKGGYSEHMPLYRLLGIRLFTLLSNFMLRFKVWGTDVTCGFRAYRLDILERCNMDINQSWLEMYEMEYYIHYKAITSGMKFKEVPVSMLYPSDKKNYSKIKAGSGWISMLRPWFYLLFRLRK